jgi:hypothetical protein
MGQMNIQTADLKANATVFYFFPPHIFKTTLASRTNGPFGFARNTSRPSQNQKSHFLPTLDRTNNFLILKP